MKLLHLILLLSFAGSGTSQVGPQVPATASSGSRSPAEIRFTYKNAQLQPARYQLELREDGSGRYRSELGDAPQATEGYLPVQPLDRDIHLSPELQEKIFRAAREGQFFAIPCESEAKNVAYQGTKTLEYEGSDGRGSCTYNWTHTPSIQYITTALEGLSLTLEEGARLDVQYRHQPLALDAELATLQDLVERKQAVELGLIAPILTTIANDEKILKRARRRAHSLLAAANSR